MADDPRLIRLTPPNGSPDPTPGVGTPLTKAGRYTPWNTPGGQRPPAKGPGPMAGASFRPTAPGNLASTGWPQAAPEWDPGRRSYAVTGPPVPVKYEEGSPYNAERRTEVLPYVEGVDVGSNWFTPGQPIWPFGPPYINYGRTWDYPLLANIEFQPRRQLLAEFLRGLASNSSILRTVIEKRKDQILSIPWNFMREDGKKGDTDPRIKKLKDYFEFPDGEHDYDAWVRMILEDHFVLDAVTVYLHRSVGGDPLQFRIYDGATIKPVIDDAGRIPDPPSVAYQQIIKGLPMVDFSKEELLYCPMNPRPQMPIYGFSPVEWVYLDIVTSIRRQVYISNFYLEGTLPDLMLQVPQDWTAQQLAQYQAFFDTLLSGNYKLKSKVRFLPAGVIPHTPKGTFGEFLKQDVDEWLARIVCAAFKINPQAYTKMMNRATAETHMQESREENLLPEMAWFSRFMNRLIRAFGWTDIYHKFLPKPEVDSRTLMEIHTGYLKMGVISRDEIRDELGKDIIPNKVPTNEPGAAFYDVTPTGDLPIGPQQPPAPPGGASSMGLMAKGKKLAYRTTFQGLPISVEQGVGQVRRWQGHDALGEEAPGQTLMRYPYGYIRLTEGADGDHIDCYLGPNWESNLVFVVRQNNHQGEYDEDKVFLGFDSRQEVMDAYSAHRQDGFEPVSSVEQMTMQEFKELLGLPKPQPISKPDPPQMGVIHKKLNEQTVDKVKRIIHRQLRSMAVKTALRAEQAARRRAKLRSQGVAEQPSAD